MRSKIKLALEGRKQRSGPLDSCARAVRLPRFVIKIMRRLQEILYERRGLPSLLQRARGLHLGSYMTATVVLGWSRRQRRTYGSSDGVGGDGKVGDKRTMQGPTPEERVAVRDDYVQPSSKSRIAYIIYRSCVSAIGL